MTVFEGLSFFEIVLLCMGVFLFIVLVFLLVWNALKQKPYKSLLPFFILPIAMIGYSSIKSVDYKGFVLTLQNATDSVTANPGDTTARTNLRTVLSNIEEKGKSLFSSPSAVVNIAQAHLSLGNYDSATHYLGVAASLDSTTPQLASVRKQVAQQVTEEQGLKKQATLLNAQLAKLETTPKDTQAVATITNTLANLKRPVYADSSSVLTVAKALATVDQGQRSLDKIDKVIKANPNSATALHLKEQVQGNSFAGKVNVTPQQRLLLEQTAASPLVSRNTMIVRANNEAVD
jgi:tetratricopeptide (TPR) repeat protein